MLDRRSEKEILEEYQALEELHQSRFASFISQARRLFPFPREMTHMVQLLVSMIIILIVIALFLSPFFRARNTAYVATCLGHLNLIGQGMEMYNSDYGAYPPRQVWYVALRPHLDVFKQAEHSDPLKCVADRSDAPVSYYYLDETLLPPRVRSLVSSIPMVVDETNHGNKVTVLWYDYHRTAIDKQAWLTLRTSLRLHRDPMHPEWFCFVTE